MAQSSTCYDCAYSYFDVCQWVVTVGMGWPNRPVCANHPDSIGRMQPVPFGGVCRNYRPKAATPGGEVRQIPLGDGLYAYVDAADYEWLNRWTWHLSNGYAVRWEKGKIIFMHREILRPPKGKIGDHVNGNRQDNTRVNLRPCLRSENARNKSKAHGTSSRFRGVDYRRASGRWHARIRFEGKLIHLGSFTDEIEAARAYDRKAVELFGQFARLNLPERREGSEPESVRQSYRPAMAPRERSRVRRREGRRSDLRS
jgi:hypothetical protein